MKTNPGFNLNILKYSREEFYRQLKGVLIASPQEDVEDDKETGTDFFTLVTSDRTQGNTIKLSQGRLILPIKENFFTQRVTGH